MQQNRQLAAILFTDIVGSTAVMQQDEQAALLMNKRYVAVLKQSVASYGGEILNDYGDGSLCTFSSATQAVRCAMQIQRQLQNEPKVPLRIGLHVGEIFFEDGKVFGDGVNVASRVQSLGIANSILFSSEICSKIKNQPEFKSVFIGKFEFKNVDEPIEVFALGNDGLTVPKKEELSGKLKEIEKKSTLRKWTTAVVVIFLLVGSFFIYQYFFHTSGFTGEKTIAVLPFENSGEPDSEEYISDGITQDIINNLSKIASLQKVIGWFSVRSFKKTTKSLKQIADELGVASILSGSIQEHEGKTRIIAELIEISTNKRLWGDDFEYEGKDILSIQSKIAADIVSALKANITPEEKKNLSKQNTENPEAYKFYLRGRNFWNANFYDSAEANYNRAIQLEPDYALPYAGLADCYDVNYAGQSQLERAPIAKIYVEKALSLDSNLSEALTTLGFIQQNFDYDWTDAKMNLEKAIFLNPNNSAAHMFYGLVLINSGLDKNKALKEFKKAVDIDPLSYYVNWNYSRNLYFAGEYDLAIQACNRMKSVIPDSRKWIADFSLGLIYLKKHEFQNAKEFFDKLPMANGTEIDNQQIMQSYGYAIMGDTIKAKALFKETLKKYPNLSHYRNSQVYIALGNFDEALKELELSYEFRDIHLFWVKADPAFDPIRNEPDFKALLKKMNLN
jgi:TolB-like protein/class 3 adenylate cyclase/lipopolysaccharide biosynthesis regulator YciM